MKPVFLITLLLAAQQLLSQGFTISPYQDFGLSTPIAADFNGDSLPDVFGVQYSSSPPSIVLQTNNGGPVLSFSEKNLNLRFETLGRPAAADMDGDLDVDVVIARNAANHVFLLKNDGMANFTLDSLGVAGANQFKVVDAEGDTDPDIFGINAATGAVLLFVNGGNQQYSTVPILASSTNLEVFDVGDLDNDGDQDVVLGFDQFSGKQIVVYQNNGSNAFQEVPVISSQFSSLGDLVVDDLDGDGKRDIIAVRSFNCEVFLNKGNLSFERKNLVSANGIIRKVATGDYNGDGRRDIVIGYNSTSITWHKNLSNDPLVFEALTVGSVSPVFSLVNSDLDKDGDTDLVVTNGEFWWYENEVPQKPSGVSILPEEAITLYPNPFQDRLYLKHSKGEPFSIVLRDSRGQTVFTEAPAPEEILLPALPSGVYFLQATNPATQQTRTIQLLKQD